MKPKAIKIRLTGILSMALVLLLALGCTPESATDKEQLAENVAKQKPKLPYAELIGRWQSDCNRIRSGRPMIVSIDFRPTFIRWSNHYYFDKECFRSDESITREFAPHYIEEVQILGDIWAHFFRLEFLATIDEPNRFIQQEVFRAQDGWLYISREGSGPDFDERWDLDSNLGLRRIY